MMGASLSFRISDLIEKKRTSSVGRRKRRGDLLMTPRQSQVIQSDEDGDEGGFPPQDSQKDMFQTQTATPETQRGMEEEEEESPVFIGSAYRSAASSSTSSASGAIRSLTFEENVSKEGTASVLAASQFIQMEDHINDQETDSDGSGDERGNVVQGTEWIKNLFAKDETKIYSGSIESVDSEREVVPSRIEDNEDSRTCFPASSSKKRRRRFGLGAKVERVLKQCHSDSALGHHMEKRNPKDSSDGDGICLAVVSVREEVFWRRLECEEMEGGRRPKKYRILLKKSLLGNITTGAEIRLGSSYHHQSHNLQKTFSPGFGVLFKCPRILPSPRSTA